MGLCNIRVISLNDDDDDDLCTLYTLVSCHGSKLRHERIRRVVAVVGAGRRLRLLLLLLFVAVGGSPCGCCGRCGLIRRAIEKVPDEDSVVVGTGHDLELVKLQPENSTRMLDQSANAKRSRGRPRVQGRGQIPHLDLAVVGAADDPLAVEPDAPDELLVALEHPETRAALDVPQSDRVVGAAGDDEAVVVLQTRDAPLVPVQRPHELAARGVPDL